MMRRFGNGRMEYAWMFRMMEMEMMRMRMRMKMGMHGEMWRWVIHGMRVHGGAVVGRKRHVRWQRRSDGHHGRAEHGCSVRLVGSTALSLFLRSRYECGGTTGFECSYRPDALMFLLRVYVELMLMLMS